MLGQFGLVAFLVISEGGRVLCDTMMDFMFGMQEQLSLKEHVSVEDLVKMVSLKTFVHDLCSCGCSMGHR